MRTRQETRLRLKTPLGLDPLSRTLFVVLMLVAPPAPALAQEFGGFDDPWPLRPADTSSPRGTLGSFIREFKQLSEAWRSDNLPAIDRAAVRAARTLDLSEIPAHTRFVDGIVKMVLLKEILDRVELPPYGRIPGKEEVAAQDITQWTIPNTMLKIAKVEEGPRKGEFLFTKETVRRLERYYGFAQNLPYIKGADVGLYQELLIAPGRLIPLRWMDFLPAWSRTVVAGQGLWQWIGLVVILLAAAVLVRWLYRLGRGWDERFTDEKPWLRFGVPVALLGAIGLALLVRIAVIDVLWLFGTPYLVMSVIILTAAFGTAAWLVVVSAGRLGDAFGQQKQGETGRLDRALMRIVFRLLGIIVVVYIGVYAAEFFGVSIAPLVAGLGVGGLAIALAVRPTLENVIGGLTLFADRPVRVGDFCRYGDQIGLVEQVGLRSTRVRSLERSIVTIPNAEFSQMKLENFMVRDRRLFRTTLQLRYETTPEQLRYVLVKLREMLLGHPKVTPDPARVRFVGFGGHSMDVEIFSYLRCQDQNTFLAIQEDILLRIADIVKEAGSGFAIPSQTAYLGRDTGLDAGRRGEAEAQVETWRARGKLPFPEFDEEQREGAEDILDYPPKGSPEYEPRTGLSEPPPVKR